jgi:hypothetical protein
MLRTATHHRRRRPAQQCHACRAGAPSLERTLTRCWDAICFMSRMNITLFSRRSAICSAAAATWSSRSSRMWESCKRRQGSGRRGCRAHTHTRAQPGVAGKECGQCPRDCTHKHTHTLHAPQAPDAGPSASPLSRRANRTRFLTLPRCRSRSVTMTARRRWLFTRNSCGAPKYPRRTHAHMRAHTAVSDDAGCVPAALGARRLFRGASTGQVSACVAGRSAPAVGSRPFADT